MRNLGLDFRLKTVIGLYDRRAAIGMPHKHQSFLPLPHLQNSLVVLRGPHLHLLLPVSLNLLFLLKAGISDLGVLHATDPVAQSRQMHEI